MKKILSFLIVLCMVLSVTACTNTVPKDSSQNEDVQKENVDADSAQYWIDKTDNPDEVVMTQDEIEAYNKTMLTQWGTEWENGYYDIQAFPETVEAQWIKDRMCYLDLKNTNIYYKGEAVSEAQWDAYYSNLNLDGISGTIEIKYGVIVHNAPAYDLPTEDIMTDSSLDESSNSLQQTLLKINEPVVILSESADSNWYYVIANEYIGWIKKENCALFLGRGQWLEFQNRENFLVVYEDNGVTEIEETLRMGTKLYLADIDECMNFPERENVDYIIRLPEKGIDGYVIYAYAGISKDNKINEGYLEYTRSAVLELAFQELGDPYGLGGIDGKRDCSSYVKDIYSCFGFMLPRNSRKQMAIPDMAIDTSSLTVEEKEQYLADVGPGAILGINGHIMLYLGSANEQHYVISMLGSYIPETVTEDFGSHIESVKKVMVNTLDVKRRNGNTWLQELLTIVDVK